MGGLDIFRAQKNSTGQWQVENLKYPINSSVDDFGITFMSEQESGYFSSSRKGKGNDDIYSFVLPPLKFSIVGVVKNEKTAVTISIPEMLFWAAGYIKIGINGSQGPSTKITNSTQGVILVSFSLLCR
jgi:hypothetical protein